MLHFNYFADAQRALYDNAYKHSLALMKKAGVDTLWLSVSMTGKYCAKKDELIAAKALLEAMGFEVNALILPVGHPGNSLNPEEALDLRLPEGWQYRISANGETEYFSACVNDVVIAANLKAVAFCRDVGFKKVFFDDDLRMGNFGDEIRGCWCESCLKAFAEFCGAVYTAKDIADACAKRSPLSEKWMDYNCMKITRFMKKTALSGIQTGIMVMQEGDRKHGIDIPAIRNAVPNSLFRVGEGHFDDLSFNGDPDHSRELQSLQSHLALVGDPSVCYSETTVFPPHALSPENLVKKVLLAVESGITNIFLMSGTWVMTDDYWNALIENRMHFEAAAEKTANRR